MTNLNSRIVVLVLIALFLLCGCADSTPITSPGTDPGSQNNPDIAASQQNSDADADGTDPNSLTSQAEPANPAERILLALYNCQYDPSSGKIEVVPVRSVERHFNVRYFLETLEVCQNPKCIQIVSSTQFDPPAGSYPPGPWLQVKVKLRNPYTYPPFTQNYMGRDVRGILMLNGSNFEFDNDYDISYSDYDPGDFVLANADGFTTNYNPVTYPYDQYAPWDSFYNGPASPENPLSTAVTLNGFKRCEGLIELDPDQIFLAGTTMEETFQIAPYPSDTLEFTFAIDASYATTGESSCREPWYVDIPEIPDITAPGAFTYFVAKAYIHDANVPDWENYRTYLICPELFGEIEFPDPNQFPYASLSEDSEGRNYINCNISAV